MLAVAALILTITLHTKLVESQVKLPDEPNVLTPPYFNIATGKKIESTATCGETMEQMFCKLTGGPNEFQYNSNLYNGQFCDMCDGSDPNRAHPIKYAIDGTEKWWQSPPLSQGSQYNRINVTIHLGQVFHVAYVIIKFANSPRAGTWVLERSSDHGKTFQPWQYFANSDSDCHNLFGIDAFEDIIRDDSVICTSEYSDVVPLERGEVIVSMVNRRPGAKNFSHSPILQEWSKATDVRIRLLRTKTLLGHLMAVQRQDPTVTRRYFYSIKDISIGGRCVCNGHADTCLPDPEDKYKLKCQCRHNTCGDSCEYCCPGFVQKKWRPAVPENANECEPCNCYGHSRECEYNEQVSIRRQSLDLAGEYEGGGVCLNCEHNTAGINCEKCVDGYYRPANIDPRDPNGCRECDCDSAFTVGTCEPVTGRCYCKPKYAGDRCDRCAPGYHMFPECEPCPCYYNATRGGQCLPGNNDFCPCKYNFAGKYCNECAIGFFNFPDCDPCTCNGQGAQGNYCDPISGQCTCDEGFGGLECEKCSPGYYNYPLCQSCSCYVAFTTDQICDAETGQCFCTDLVTGDSCNQCLPGYYDFPRCKECECSSPGSLSSLCDAVSGRCQCKPNYQGNQCDECAPEFYDFPNCVPCDCDIQGSQRTTCDLETGECICFNNIGGRRCDQCAPDYFNFPRCEDCKCDPRGIKSIVPGVCLAFTTGQCDCKENVIGKYCNMCSPLHYNLDLGCVSCNCLLQGTLDGVAACDTDEGQCWCKLYATSQRCSQCEDGFFGLEERNYFGCNGCQCDKGGALSDDCDTNDGQCECRNGVEGRQCNRVGEGYFYPTLLQHRFEVEEGRITENKILRFGFDEQLFPNFSMKGYGEFSGVQPEIILDVTIARNSLYKVLIRYINPHSTTLSGTLSFIPNPFPFGSEKETGNGTDSDCPDCSEQSFQVVFESTTTPAMMTIKDVFVLNRGKWNVVIQGEPGLLIDYLVLLPSQYYEPGILQAKITEPCKPELNPSGNECLMYTHPDLSETPYALMTHFADSVQHDAPTTAHPQMVVLDGSSVNDDFKTMTVTLQPERAGKYVLVLIYASMEDRMQTIEATVTDGADKTFSDVKFNVYSCGYSFLCRQVALTPLSDVMVFDIDVPSIQVDLSVNTGEKVYVRGIHAIPYEEWNIELVEPKALCLTKTGPEFDECINWGYPIPATATKFEVGSGKGGDGDGGDLDGDGTTSPPGTTGVDAKHINSSSGPIQIEMDLVPGRYVFLLHYYNPNHLSFSPSIVLSGGPTYEGSVNVVHCPSLDGCRGVVTTNIGDIVLDITNPTQTMTITVPEGNSFWLDYVLAIPEHSYNAELLDLMPIDNSRKFFDECYGVGSEGLVDSSRNPSEFCRTAIFSLTMDFNDGAIECECNVEGTINNGEVDCEDYGGQCPCKPNVIGRQCDRCNIGYYGFPDCKPCDCDGRLCDDINGNCICPPNTVAPACNQCMPFTHSFHPLAGCEFCDCHPEGSDDRGCNTNDGQCTCKENVEGQRCDKCKPGFFGFPDCQPCVCDERGRLSEGCDATSGQCLCKENVEGQQCDRCKVGTFYLDANNPLGCTKCFCFGATLNCHTTSYPITEISQMDGWRLLNMKIDDPEVRLEGDQATVNIFENGGARDSSRANLYWAAPKEYLGDLVGSYGGVLRYVTESKRGGRSDSSGFSTSNAQPAPLSAPSPEVILMGNGMTIGWVNRDYQGDYTEGSLNLTEKNFIHQNTGDAVKREEMMMVLGSLSSLRIRASRDPDAAIVSIAGVSLTTTNYEAPIGSGPSIPSVEQCECPDGYTGQSCQLCAKAYYRNSNIGPYLGYCYQCDCYGHCDSCDEVGMIKSDDDCLHNTAGDDCGECKPGYIGDAKNGSPDDCQPCPCPYPSEDGNFAETCEEKGDGSGEIICFCQEEYAGEKCDQCAVGYFGNPTVIGGECQKCNCHGNLDINLITETCDPVTGKCYDCQFNTGGNYCERCADGYYGDAIVARNCTACSCLTCGTLQCDYQYGHCACKPHVIGELCNKCEPGYYNLESCNGCQDCSCAIGATSKICDEFTGNCECAPNVVGMKCDKCAPGHWDYSEMGCKPCNCRNNGACNPVNGACKCPPGITGPQCDQCKLPRQILPPGGLQCENCGSCTHDLLDTIEPLTSQVKDSTGELSRVSVGVAAAKKLETYEKRKNAVEDGFNRLGDDMASIMDPQSDDTLAGTVIPGLTDAISGSGENEGSGIPAPIESQPLEQDGFASVKSALAKTDDAVTEMCNHTETLQESTEKTSSRMIRLKENAGVTETEIDQFLADAQDLLEKLEEESSGDTVEYLQKLRDAEMLLERMKNRDFNPLKVVADDEMKLAQDLFDEVNVNFTLPADDIEKQVNQVSDDLGNKLEKMRQLRTLLNQAIQNVTDVETSNAANNKELTGARDAVNKIKEEWDKIKQIIEDAQRLLTKPEGEAIAILSTDALNAAVDELQSMVEAYNASLAGMQDLVNRSIAIAEMLRKDADMLAKLVEDTKNDPRNVRAIEAANRYQNIINKMEIARNAADQADLDATEAKEQVEQTDLVKSAEEALVAASSLLSEVQKTLKKIKSLRKDLTDAQTSSQEMAALAERLSGKLDDVKEGINSLDHGDIDGDVQTIKSDSAEAERIAKKAEEDAINLEKDINSSIDLDVPVNDILTNLGDVVSGLPDKVVDMEDRIIELKERSSLLKELPSIYGLQEKIDEIRKLIELSRSRADSVRLSMSFKRQDGVEVPEYAQIHVPPHVYNLDDHVRIELYVNTSNAPDNSLLYLGDSSSNEGDYVALETIGGKVHYYYKVGSGVGELQSDVAINDNKWHRIIIERMANKGKLEVDYELVREGTDLIGLSQIVVEKKEGTTSNLDLKANLPAISSPFIVGGLPPIMLPDKIQNKQMSGCVEDVRLNNESIGLWNFISYKGPQPGQTCPRRETVDSRQFWRFRGYDSYLRVGDDQLAQQKFYVRRNDISFVFRFKFFTVQSDSLLFFIGESTDNFFALELRGGKFVLTCNFGFADGVKQKTLKNYRDITTIAQPLIIKAGVVNLRRNNIKMIVLSINSDLNLNMTFTDWNPDIRGDAWVGGIYRTDIKDEFRQYITNIDTHFRGCLSDLAFHIRDTFSIYDAKERVGVNPGCRRESITNIYVDGDDFISIATDVPNIERLLGSVTMRTESPEGTIIVATEASTTTEVPFDVETVVPFPFGGEEGEDRLVLAEEDEPEFKDGHMGPDVMGRSVFVKPEEDIDLPSSNSEMNPPSMSSSNVVQPDLIEPDSSNTGKEKVDEENPIDEDLLTKEGEKANSDKIQPADDLESKQGDDLDGELGLDEENEEEAALVTTEEMNKSKEIRQPDLNLADNAQVAKKDNSGLDGKASGTSVLPAILIIVGVIVGIGLFAAVISVVMKGSMLSGSNGTPPANPPASQMEQAPLNNVQAQRTAQMDW